MSSSPRALKQFFPLTLGAHDRIFKAFPSPSRTFFPLFITKIVLFTRQHHRQASPFSSTLGTLPRSSPALSLSSYFAPNFRPGEQIAQRERTQTWPLQPSHIGKKSLTAIVTPGFLELAADTSAERSNSWCSAVRNLANKCDSADLVRPESITTLHTYPALILTVQ
jgi:hypothetical protein